MPCPEVFSLKGQAVSFLAENYIKNNEEENSVQSRLPRHVAELW